MTGFKPGISGVGSDCSTNWATTTAQIVFASIELGTEKAAMKILMSVSRAWLNFKTSYLKLVLSKFKDLNWIC